MSKYFLSFSIIVHVFVDFEHRYDDAEGEI
jgi:hypothetical protein